MPPVRTTTFARGSFTRGDTSTDTIRSMETVTQNFEKFVNNVKHLSEDLAKQAGEAILKATDPLVPVQYGSLKESGRAHVDKTDKGTRARVSYGGPDAQVTPSPNAPAGVVDYAVVVHEDMSLVHKVGQAKYLQTGAKMARPAIEKLIEKFGREATKPNAINVKK